MTAGEAGTQTQKPLGRLAARPPGSKRGCTTARRGTLLQVDASIFFTGKEFIDSCHGLL